MNKNRNATIFVLVALAAGLLTAAGLFFGVAGETGPAAALITCCVPAAAVLVAAAVRVAARLRAGRRETQFSEKRPRGVVHALSLAQWMALLVGLALTATGTAALTGVRMLAGGAAGAAAAPVTTTAGPAQPAPTTAAADPVTTAPTSAPPSPSATASPVPASTDPDSTPAPVPGSTAYLDSATTIAGYYRPKAVTFSATRYPRGISFDCTAATRTYVQWNVAGSARFDATAGIDDTTGDTFGKIVELIFYDQDGHQLVPKPVEASVGHAAKITINLTGVVSLRMTCATRDSKTNRPSGTDAALGDPTVVYA